MTIRQARTADLHNVALLLQSASLPTEGIADHFANFLVAEDTTGIVGAIGLEVYEDVGLLRSAVVTPKAQGDGIGSALYAQLIERARGLRLTRLILLTETAEQYFAKKGFRRIDQNSVIGPIRHSVEFSGACPSHAVCMELLLH